MKLRPLFKNFPSGKSPEPEGVPVEFHPTFKEDLIPIISIY